MMDFDKMRERYLNDPLFHRTVDLLYNFLYEGNITVNELRDAATFAGFKFESEQVRPIFHSPSPKAV